MRPSSLISVVLISFLMVSCSAPSTDDSQKKRPSLRALDIQQIEKVLAMKGTESNGEYKVTVAQNDLNMIVDDFKIIAPMGLGSWAAFAPAPDGAMVMGDIVVTETDLMPVQQEVIKHGLMVTAIHNHFVRNTPNIMYMHIGGIGTEEKLAVAIKAVFEKVKEVRGHDPAAAIAETVNNTLSTDILDTILGYKGEMARGVYKYTIGRPDVELTEHDAPVSSFLGFNTWAAWQGTPDRAAVAGDFTMLANEVTPVIAALVENGIEVVAVHNHMIHEEPRIFFLHYWGVGPAEKLAKGLKAALDQVGKAPSKQTASLFPGFTEVLCGID